jgi:predicted kinase
VDIDGTIADIKHREHFVTGEKKDWKKFFEFMGDDSITNVGSFIDLVLNTFGYTGVSKFTPVFLFSGRPDDYRGITEKWLENWYPSLHKFHEALLMRPSGDFRKDSIIKREMLSNIRNQGYEPLLVIDDRQQVVDMWKEEGITCLQHVNYLEPEKKVTAMKPGKLAMAIGPSGAGKTVSSPRLRISDWVYISSDDMRHNICGSFKDQSRNNEVFAVIHELIKRNIELGFDVWYDATNIRDKDRKTILNLLSDDTQIQYWIYDRPLADKHETAGWRDMVTVKDGQKLIDYHHNIFQSNLKAILKGDNDPRVTVYDRRLM